MSQQLIPLVKTRLIQTCKLYLAIFVPMWVFFILNNTVFLGAWNTLGIEPRELIFGNLVGVLGSWTMHSSMIHITNNTLIMAQLLFLFGLFERNAFKTLCKLIIGSGMLTWLLGSDNSIHIGASGLAFAMMGYMLGGALFAKRWGYLIACIVLGSAFWFAMLQGLIPTKGISFAGHFGGLIAGLLYGADSEKKSLIEIKKLGRYNTL